MKRLGWAILPALLTGCVVGPNYGGPPGVASGERAGSTFRRADQAVTLQTPVARWWEGMGDAQLTKLIDRALASNPDVAIAEARIRKARASLREQRASQLPTVSASGTAIVADLPAGSLALPTQGEQSDRIRPNSTTPAWMHRGRSICSADDAVPPKVLKLRLRQPKPIELMRRFVSRRRSPRIM